MSQFEQLMQELSTLGTDQQEMAKALPADDGKDEEKIQAAAAEGGSDGDADDKGGKPDGDADDKVDGKPMAKSLQVTLPDGTQADAIDGTEMVKSLESRMEQSEGQMLKAMESAVGLIKGQATLIKSLQDQVTKLSNEGRGRKSSVTVNDKPAGTPLAKSEPAGVTPEVFFAKALVAQREGRISGTEIAMAESCLNRGLQIPPAIVARVVQ